MLRRMVPGFIAAVLVVAVSPAVSSLSASENGFGDVKRLDRPERPRSVKSKDDYDPDTLLVRFKPGTSSASKDRAVGKHGAKRAGALPHNRYEQVRADGKAARIAPSLRKDPAVADVAYNFRRTTTATPNDPAYAQGYQKYLKTIRMSSAWDKVKDARSQVVAVVDTGVDRTHADLSGKLLTGYNAISPGQAPNDDNGHGTMVAGIVAAGTGNGEGIAGVAWYGRVMPVKVLDGNGQGFDADIAEGITWAADHGAKVINLSLGGTQDSPALADAVKYAAGKGVVVVAASGNYGDDTTVYPAAYPEVLAVGATDNAANLTDFSSSGDWVDIAAPGFDITSTYPDDQYATASGTSFAAPITAGVAALVRARYPSLTAAEVRARLTRTARDAGPRGLDPYYGAGFLDAYAAVGGTPAAAFAQRSLGTGEPNDVPARAAAFTTSTSGTVAMEGDVDWYRFDSAAGRTVDVTVTPPALMEARAQNFDPMLSVYDDDLRLLGTVDAGSPGVKETVKLDVNAGTTYVKVSNFNGAADTRSYSLKVTSTTAGLLRPAEATSVASRPETVTIGDVTGDGRADAVLTTTFDSDEINDYKLFVFAQQPNGTLTAPVKYATSLGYADKAGLAVLDANSDGRRDIALATVAGVEIFAQSESGTLGPGVVIPGTAKARHLVAADMDGDGDSDLVAATATGIVELAQGSNGEFTVSAVSADLVREIEVGDVTGDGQPEVVGFVQTSMIRYVRNGDGWSKTEYPTGHSRWIEGAEVADVTGDSRRDVVATVGGNPPTAQAVVFAQQDDGSLAPPASYAANDLPGPVEAGDMNSDSRLDLVLAHGGGSVSVMPQQSDGTLGAPIRTGGPVASRFNTQGLAVGDLNGDDFPDVALANYNSGLVVLRNAQGRATAGEQEWVRSVSPSDFATGRSRTAPQQVSFQRELDASSVTTDTVRLLNGKTGAAVPGSVSYDAGTKTATFTPDTAPTDATPYRIVVDGVRDSAGATQVERFTTTFTTVDEAPPPVDSFTARGGYKKANLSWTRPAVGDFARVVVRMASGSTPPASPTSGTEVYRGSGSSAQVTGLSAGASYSFSVWVQDKGGHSSTAKKLTLVGTKVEASASPSTVSSGGTVKVSGKLLRAWAGTGIGGQDVVVYTRPKGGSTWYKVGTVNTSSSGSFSIEHVTTRSREYWVRYDGSAELMGSASSVRSVTVR